MYDIIFASFLGWFIPGRFSFLNSRFPHPIGKPSRRDAASNRNPLPGYLLKAAILGGAIAGLSGCGTIIPTASTTAGALTVSTNQVNFGSVTLGQTVGATVDINNTGSAAVEITNIGLAGSAFSVNGQNNVPIRIAAGGSYSLSIAFHPVAAGISTGSVTLSTNASASGNLAISLDGTGQTAATNAPGLTLSASNLNFGNVAVNTTSTLKLTLTSSGSAPLTISAGSESGPGFSLSGVNFPLTLASGQAAVISVAFNPTSTGVANGVITLQTNTSAGSVTIALSGTGAPASGAALPGLTLSATSLNFGNVTVGSPASIIVTLTSSGTAPVTVSAASVSGTGFSLSGIGFPLTLNPGQTAALNIGFNPGAAGVATGSVTLTTNASSGAATIALTGTGDTVAAGGLSALTCANASMTAVGADNCTVSLAAAAGTGGQTVLLASSSTSVTVPASVTVAAGATSAAFAATVSSVATAQTAVLTATAGGVTRSYSIQIGAATPALTLQTTSVAFGTVSLNTTATQTVLLTSSGTAPLTISAGSISGTGFTLSGASFPLTLNPGQTASLQIAFKPTAAGAASGVVSLATNTSAGTASIALTGTGGSVSYAVDLSWQAPSGSTDAVTGYDIYRQASGSSSYELLNSSLNTSTTYNDTTVQSGTSYTYYVVSVDASGTESAPSNVFQATIP